MRAKFRWHITTQATPIFSYLQHAACAERGAAKSTTQLALQVGCQCNKFSLNRYDATGGSSQRGTVTASRSKSRGSSQSWGSRSNTKRSGEGSGCRADKTLLRLSLPNRRSQQRILGKVANAALSTISEEGEKPRERRQRGAERGAQKASRGKRKRQVRYVSVPRGMTDSSGRAKCVNFVRAPINV